MSELATISLPSLPRDHSLTRSDVETWIPLIVDAIGQGFHPDTKATDYRFGGSPLPRQTAIWLDVDLCDAYQLLGDAEFYDLFFHAMWDQFGVELDASRTTADQVCIPAVCSWSSVEA